MKRLFKLAFSLLFVATVIGMIVYVNLYPEKNGPVRNIFDEIYKTNADTSNPAYYHGDYKVGIRVVRATDENMVDTRHLNAYITYKEKRLPEGYQSVTVDFFGYNQYMAISFDKELTQGLVLNEYIKYYPEEKLLEKRINIIKSEGETDNYIDNKSQVKAYLKNYHIGKKDLDHYYDEIIYGLVLKDWLTNYDSKYTTNDYGEFTTKTQWENW